MQTHHSRRAFLQRSLTVSAASFLVVSSRVLGRGAEASPNSKLNLAGIGVGGQGASNLRELQGENIVALCDPDSAYAANTFRRYPQARQFKDYRRMLDEMKEIDGVMIATPDHHHAPAALEALRRGKHVYCEKPLTHSVWESRRLAQATREAKVATQMGNGGQASDETRLLSELVWSGVIGEVREAHIWTDRPSNGLFNEYWPQGVGRPGDKPAVPATLDWDLWLGPAPERPFHPAYLPFKWRGWWDFGTGALGDIGCHAMDPVFRALKLGTPLSVQASSTRVNAETFPLGSMVTYRFPARDAAVQSINRHIAGLSGAEAGGLAMPPCKLVWYDGGLRPPRPEGLPDGVNMGDNGRLLIGDKGFILGGTAWVGTPPKQVRPGPLKMPRSPGHHVEWVRGCKGGPPPGSNFEWAAALTEVVLLGNVPLRVKLREDLTRHGLLWDAKAFKFTNLDDANAFLRRDYRPGWAA